MNPVGEWSLFWHFVAFPGLIIATFPFQPFGFVVAVLVVAVFPASAALIAITSSLQQAFNPAAIAGFARTLGSDYVSLVLGCIAMVAGALVLQAYVIPAFGVFSLLLGLMVELWGLLATFALIGTAVRRHRLEFEILGELVPQEDAALARRHAEWKKTLDIAYASFRSGLNPAGYKTLRELVDANGDSIEVNYWLLENMLDWEQKRFAIDVASKLIPRLIARDEKGDKAHALELYHRCRRRVPEFRLPAAEADELAAHARSVGQTGIAAELSYNRVTAQTDRSGRTS
jgi:hypothetical protein